MDETDFCVAVIGSGPAARADVISFAARWVEPEHDDAAKIVYKKRNILAWNFGE
jgi:hypothetical protein